MNVKKSFIKKCSTIVIILFLCLFLFLFLKLVKGQNSLFTIQLKNNIFEITWSGNINVEKKEFDSLYKKIRNVKLIETQAFSDSKIPAPCFKIYFRMKNGEKHTLLIIHNYIMFSSSGKTYYYKTSKDLYKDEEILAMGLKYNTLFYKKGLGLENKLK